MSKKPRILIIDDDNATREMYSEVFKNSDFDVAEAKDGLEGLDMATKEAPDVIFTGIIMPRMDGFTLMESLKKNVTTVNVPVVISSHLGREEDQQKAKKLGAKEFIVRDVTPPNEVVKIVKGLIVGGRNYRVKFDTRALDAPKVARDINLDDNFQCMECNEEMIMNLELEDLRDKTFKANFTCPSCGWKA